MFCENCGSQIPEGAKACSNCGCPAPAAAVAPTPVAPAPETVVPAPAVAPAPVEIPTPVVEPSVAVNPAPFADAMAGGNVASPVDPVPVGSVVTPVESMASVEPVADPMAGINPAPVDPNPAPFASAMAGGVPSDPVTGAQNAPFANAMAGGSATTSGVTPMAGMNPSPSMNSMGAQGVAPATAPNPAPAPVPAGSNSMNIIALICAISSIVFGTLGVIMFGIPCGVIAIGTGVAGLILGINVQKTTNKAKGLGAFVCGLIGLVLSAFFTIGCIGCATCGGCKELSGSGNYACYGCVGGGCLLRQDAEKGLKKATKSITQDFDYDDLNDLADALSDWDY